MGFLDKVKGAVKGHGKQIDKGVDQANKAAKARLDDKYDSKLDMGAAKAKETVAKLDRES
jgi:hypothetical protein